jgi:hypothetical protein
MVEYCSNVVEPRGSMAALTDRLVGWLGGSVGWMAGQVMDY